MFIKDIEWLRGLATTIVCSFGTPWPDQSRQLSTQWLDLSLHRPGLGCRDRAWLLRRAPNMLLIPGTSSVTHLRENIAAAELNLPDTALEALGGGASIALNSNERG